MQITAWGDDLIDCRDAVESLAAPGESRLANHDSQVRGGRGPVDGIPGPMVGPVFRVIRARRSPIPLVKDPGYLRRVCDP